MDAILPEWGGIAMPPNDVLLETPGLIVRAAHAIRVHAILTAAMLQNNITQISKDERRALSVCLDKL